MCTVLYHLSEFTLIVWSPHKYERSIWTHAHTVYGGGAWRKTHATFICCIRASTSDDQMRFISWFDAPSRSLVIASVSLASTVWIVINSSSRNWFNCSARAFEHACNGSTLLCCQNRLSMLVNCSIGVSRQFHLAFAFQRIACLMVFERNKTVTKWRSRSLRKMTTRN